MRVVQLDHLFQPFIDVFFRMELGDGMSEEKWDSVDIFATIYVGCLIARACIFLTKKNHDEYKNE